VNTTDPQHTEPDTDLPARLEAVLTERYTELGNPFSGMRRREQGPDGWPASHPVGPRRVAEVLRELLPAAAPAAAPAAVPPAADRAALRDRIRRAVCEAEGFAWDSDMLEPDEYGEVADMVLSALPASTDRASVLREAADAVARFTGNDLDANAKMLRRMADETPRAETERCANCGREIENRGDPDMGGNHEIRWVHVPGGYTVCNPQQPNSPRATPAAPAQPAKEPVWCSAVALRVHHASHDWTPQPGMDPVHCAGYPQPAKEA
jgi:hypothetical protein